MMGAICLPKVREIGDKFRLYRTFMAKKNVLSQTGCDSIRPISVPFSLTLSLTLLACPAFEAYISKII